jgi:glutathione S-transferase
MTTSPSSAALPLRLHGYAVSNYFNIARAALIEKGATFDIVRVRASQEEAFLRMSPLGKIPFLETPSGFLSETIPILEYLEECVVAPALYPRDPLQRGRVRQVMNIVQLYLDMQVRKLYPGVYLGGSNPAETIQATSQTLEITINGLRRLFTFGPFLLGDTLTAADLFMLYCADVADRVTRFVYGWSLIERIDGLAEWSMLMSTRDSSRVVSAEFLHEFRDYLSTKGAAYNLGLGGGIFAESCSAASPATVESKK